VAMLAGLNCTVSQVVCLSSSGAAVWAVPSTGRMRTVNSYIRGAAEFTTRAGRLEHIVLTAVASEPSELSVGR